MLPVALAIMVCALFACGAASASPAPKAAALSSAQRHYLRLAELGVARAMRAWRDPHGWYDALLADRQRYPLATIWDIVPLFESLDAIAIADPVAANRRALTHFAAGAERYLNLGLRPVSGYSPYPGDRGQQTDTWFDDNGWWGLAFVGAYAASGERRYLADAQRALRFIAASGWDATQGGIWWNTSHPYKSGPALASATLLASVLYQRTHAPLDLSLAERFLTWADTAGFSAADGLYADSSIDRVPVDYVQAPLIYARALLCRLAADGISQAQGCAPTQTLTATAVRRFGQLLDFAPQYDAIYLQWMLALYALDGDSALYRMASANADRAQSRALDPSGLFLRSWSGGTLPEPDAQPGMLRTDAATTSLFAWLAVYPPPR